MSNYCIKKKVVNQCGDNGKVEHVIMTDGSSEIWEFDSKKKVVDIVKVLNANTDNGCEYRVWQIEPLTS